MNPKTAKAHRFLKVEAYRQDDEGEDIFKLRFSSETPYKRWFGDEILGHDKGEVDLTRLNDAHPFLLNHRTETLIGSIVRAWTKDGEGHAEVRFSNSALAQEVKQDIIDGHRPHISVGYFVKAMKLMEETDDKDVYRVTEWEPFEISSVPIPADHSVGFDRSLDEEEDKRIFETFFKQQTEVKIMSDPIKKADEVQEGLDTVNEEKIRSLNLEIQAMKKEGEATEKLGELMRTIATTFGEAVPNAAELSARAQLEGTTTDEVISKFKKFCLEAIDKKTYAKHDPSIGMSKDEAKRFSILRLIRGATALAEGSKGNQKHIEEAAFELEASRVANDERQNPVQFAVQNEQHVTIPADVLMSQRDFNVGTATEGGNLVDTTLSTSNFIDFLRDSMVLQQMGIRTMSGLVGDVSIPRQLTGAAFTWLAENGTTTETSATIDQLSFTYRTIGAHTDLSRKFIQQSSIDAESFATTDLLRALAHKIDEFGLNGDGTSNAPVGIANVTGVNDIIMGTNGDFLTWADIVDFETQVNNPNIGMNSRGYLMNSATVGNLKTTTKTTEQGGFIYENDMVNGTRVGKTNALPRNLTKGTGTNLSRVIYGEFAEFVMAMWGGIDLLVNPYSLSTSGAIRIGVFQSLDFLARRATAFSVSDDVQTQ